MFEFEKHKGRSLHLPAGSFGEATLLTGVFAPITGDPLPVLMKLDAALIGPQRSRVPIRDAFLVGKAQGDANSKRAVIQLELLSVIRPDGTPLELKTNGWATDDDGIQGLRGDYVWRADEIVALASLTGALSGGAEALAQRETVSQVTPLGGSQSTVTGDPLRFAGYKSLGSAFGRLGDMVSQRLQEIVPAIHVANAKTITVAFINGVTLEGFEIPDPTQAAFSGLDW
jgi:conjugal transfer pilus assembly protein TraB